MRDEARLRQLIRRRLAAGALPAENPRQAWGGTATGQRCLVCEEFIDAGSLEIETEGADGQRHFYHPPCFALLDDERRRMTTPTARRDD